MKKNYIIILILIVLAGILFLLVRNRKDKTFSVEIGNWKFRTENDSVWNTIKVSSNWESEGYSGYDGNAYYRAKVVIPSCLKSGDSEMLAFCMGKIDDNDSIFLNDRLIGSTSGWSKDRVYYVPCSSPFLKWDAENVITVKVMDLSGPGGMYDKQPVIRKADKIEFVDLDEGLCSVDGGKISQRIFLRTIKNMSVSGKLNIKLVNNETGKVALEKDMCVELSPDPFAYTFNGEIVEKTSFGIIYRFTDESSGKFIESRYEIPYILTSPAPAEPRINGPGIYGVRPGSPVVYRIPVTGERPLTLSVDGLPQGLSFDAEKGVISGKIARAGRYKVSIAAFNGYGSDIGNITFCVGNKLALTPPMGWNSWNCWGLTVDDGKVRAAADAFIESGLADYGWSYINIDDGWEAPERDGNGNIVANDKFPDMKELTGYVHGKGLKMGLYSSPGPTTCGGFLGSFLHEAQDAATWARWGFDYIKYDWCGYSDVKPHPTQSEMKEPYELMGDILQFQPRDIVYSLCQYGMGDVWKWGNDVKGNLWRTTGDINDTWKSMSEIGFSQLDKYPYAGPGRWNDPDMLVVGKLGWGNLRPSRLTPDEQYTHISLWCLLSSPLLIGCDLRQMDDFTRNLLCNSDVIAIDQDTLGKQAGRIYKNDDLQVIAKPLSDGGFAVGLFNLSSRPLKKAVFKRNMLKLEGSYEMRDLWRAENLGEFRNRVSFNIPPHGVVLLRFLKLK
ncbi:MAG: putative Ig domain-containing protein [Bacteroidales bacterium]|nr:putative Ig domain-containing protein [Bacteroidales bacterium]